VVGFDDIDAAALVRPSLTTVAQDQRALGEAAVAALRGLLDGPEPAPRADRGAVAASRIVPTRLLVRGSSRSGA
jgi:LacI family transcriptional regulator